jgi:hypothetical protein
MDLNFHNLDRDFDEAVEVAKGKDGTFYLQANSPEGRCAVRIWVHPHMAVKIRDWLIANYQAEEATVHAVNEGK